MTGALLLASLPCAALGLVLGHAKAHLALASIAAAVVVAAGSCLLAGAYFPAKLVVVLLAMSVAGTVFLLYFPRLIRPGLLLAVAANAGFWTGAALADPPALTTLPAALPWLALALPARWLVRKKWDTALKVAGSWLLAISLLSGALNTVSMPSYERDHME